MHFAMFTTALALSLFTTVSAQQPPAPQPPATQPTPQSPTSQPPSQQTRVASDADGKTITVVGCLQTGAQQNQFVLSAVADQLSKGVAVATSGAVPNVTYLLSGGENLAAHVGHRVEITGTTSGKPQTAETSGKNVRETKVPNKPDPKVEVKEKTVIEVRGLEIRSLKMVSPSCESK